MNTIKCLYKFLIYNLKFIEKSQELNKGFLYTLNLILRLLLFYHICLILFLCVSLYTFLNHLRVSADSMANYF